MPGRVSAEAEEGGMTEGHDARIAEDQVERESEQADDRDFVQDEVALGQQERASPRRRARKRFRAGSTGPSAEGGADLSGRSRASGLFHLITAHGRRALAGEERERRS